MSISRPALVLALALAPACTESPSVELRWRIQTEDLGEDDAAPKLTSIRQCTEVGLRDLRLTTRKDGLPVDVREISCFPSEFASDDGLTPGPELDDGTYEFTLEGLRRGTDTPWAEGVSVSATVTVRGDVPVPLDDLVLPAPPTCDDGVDNDGDGYVDSNDVDCRVADARESNLVTTIQFFVRPTFLGDNPYVTCGTLGISQFSLRVDDDPTSDRLIGCATQTSSFSRRVDPDPTLNPHTISIVGLGFGGEAVTQTKTTSFELSGSQGKPVDVDAAFVADDLLAPLVAPLQFIVVFEANQDAAKNLRSCAADADSDLVISEISLEVVSLDTGEVMGVPIDPPVLLEGGDLDGTALDGSPLPCQATALRTQPLEWGNYGLRISGLSAEGDTCYSTDAALQGAPGILINAVVPRVSTEDSCAD